MLTHPIFLNILMHSDDELAEALGSGVARRENVHEWPLSCVQMLQLDNGAKLAYKSQLPPTEEADFYERATSKLLPGHRVLGKLGACDTMVIEWIDAPLLSRLELSDTELAEHGKRIIALIGEIEGELPAYLNIGSSEAWSDAVQITVERLGKLVMDGRFRLADPDAVRHTEAWSKSPAVREAVACKPHVIHGDLKADQVFVTADGYRVIDWQRPIVAPPDVDLVSLMVGQGIDPYRFADAAAVGIFWFLRLYWAVEAQYNLFPGGRRPLFDQWASEAIGHILKI